VSLGAIIDDAYHAAGLHPDNIDTGVVILMRSAIVARTRRRSPGYRERGGESVCATAGHHMEATLAAYV
jgi:ethanolamine utilization protein EutA